MNELALFAGAGGGLLAGALLEWRTICAVECDPYAASVLAARQNDLVLPAFPIWDDVRTFDGRPWRGSVDVVSGGFPCQRYSTAARGRNVAVDLLPEMVRVVADVAPWCVFAENVSKKAIDYAGEDFQQMGYHVRKIRLSAEDVGGDHIRERYWLLAYADGYSELLRAKYAEVAGVPRLSPSVWECDPGVARIPNGLADRMERLSVTGNGQVPLVAACAFLECVGAI